MRLVIITDVFGDVLATCHLPLDPNAGDIHISAPPILRLEPLWPTLPHWRTYGWDDEFPPPPPPMAGVDLGMRWREYVRRL